MIIIVERVIFVWVIQSAYYVCWIAQYNVIESFGRRVVLLKESVAHKKVIISELGIALTLAKIDAGESREIS